jgi:tetratricopeptide (TPR) repeat protein
MSSVEHWRRVSAIFHAVTDAPAAQRDRIVAEMCGHDAELKVEICALLTAHDSTTSFLDDVPAQLLHLHLQPGDVLCDRFVVGRHLGTGGMGEVWAAHDKQLNEDIAIKTVRDAIAIDEPGLARLKREIHLARRIAHPNVCRVHDLFEDSSGTRPRLFLTMELVEGETLATRLARDGRVPLPEALAIMRQLVAGLAAAHAANVVHRDLKPSNVMLTPSPAGRVVIMDFGLARLFDSAAAPDSTASAGTAVAGTPDYMAPEQIAGGVATATTDVYALGLLLFEILRGERPFGGGTFDSWLRRARERPAKLTGVVPGVDRHIDDVIARCLEYEPRKRFKSVDDVWAALRRRPVWFLPRRVSSRAAAIAGIAVAAGIAWQLAQRQSSVPSADALRWYADAARELAEGASVRALNSVNRAIEATPGFALAHARLAEILLELDMPGRAQEAMLAATAATPPGATSADASYVNGMRQLLLRNCDTAISLLRQHGAGGGVADRPYRLLSLARAQERCGRPDEARKVLAEAAALDARNAAVAVRQARLFALESDDAKALMALDRAERLFQDRTNMEGVCEVLVERGTLQASRDDLDGATTTLTKAVDIATSLDDVRQRVRARLQLAIVHRKRGDIATAERLTTEAIDLAGRQHLETLTLEGLFANGNVHVVRNQFPQALSLFQLARGIAESNRHEEHRARAYLSIASVYVRVMEPDKAEEAVQTARPYYERTKQTHYLVDADGLMSRIRFMRAEYPTLASYYEAELIRTQKAGNREQEVAARQGLASARAAMGLLPDALEEYQRVLAAYRNAGRKRDEAFTLLNLADTYSQLGRFAEAAATRREVEHTGPMPIEIQSQLLLWRAADALRQGHYQTALTDAARSRQVGGGRSAEREGRAHLITCAAAVMVERAAQGAPSCAHARTVASSKSSVPFWLETQLVDAEVKLRLGTPIGVREVLNDVLRVVDKSEARADRWRVLALSAALKNGSEPEAWSALTHELDGLRMLWGEAAYSSWQRRADVRSLLLMAGATKGG